MLNLSHQSNLLSRFTLLNPITTIQQQHHHFRFPKLHNLTITKTPSTLTRTITTNNASSKPLELEYERSQEKSFWGAVSLIIGTAVGPGMLGLPSATIKSGPLPSTIAILLSWVYVISSILLVAELSFATMEEDGVGEVSFTGLATKALGGRAGTFIALVYACLSFSLLIACVSGIGSIMMQWFPWMNLILAHAFFPCIVGMVIGFFPFKAIDSVNRLLCVLMLFSITSLVGIGLSMGRTNLLALFAYSSWSPSAILPAIPVTVLTLGFHVITPFICKIVGRSVFDARNAILFGGVVPLVMVLSWNLVVLGLSKVGIAASLQDPILLLLSVSSSALPAVQGFAFTALATSLIGYTVSFPKQLVDTVELILKESSLISSERRSGKIGSVVYSNRDNVGTLGVVSFNGKSGVSQVSSNTNIYTMPLVLGASILIVSFFPAVFSKALDFAGVYANCFLFGVLPPVMALIHRSKKKPSSTSSRAGNLLPGGNIVLFILFGIAVILGIWH
ncbi:hypothetical protein GIB67_037768 [Kingdonia uniflora]|uniref:Tyrosine-specific transport protein n=1 Tax=Kingdonia uniflora TaxID=39325 RepID=A0A7J7LV83_9MAGN|nr:hypothetical protein GIB67_037768 [Kingdonia uniflora]